MIDNTVQAQLDPKRAILRFLKENKKQKPYGYNIQQIKQSLKISRPTVSKYCAILLTANKIKVKQVGTNKVYSI
jgi:response regulator of citrate/malate metabolism